NWLTRLADDPSESRVSKRILHGHAFYRIHPPCCEDKQAPVNTMGGEVESKGNFTLSAKKERNGHTGVSGDKPSVPVHPSTSTTTNTMTLPPSLEMCPLVLSQRTPLPRGEQGAGQSPPVAAFKVATMEEAMEFLGRP